MRRITLALSVLFLGYAGAALADPVRLTSATMFVGNADVQGNFDLSSSAAARSPDVDVPSVALFDDDVRNLTGDDDGSPAVGAMPPSGDTDVDKDKDKNKGGKDNDSGGGSKTKPSDGDDPGSGGGGGGNDPTPEPASMLLLGTGLAAAWQSRRLHRDR